MEIHNDKMYWSRRIDVLHSKGWSQSGENFLSLQCNGKGGGGLMILLVNIAIHK